MYFLRSWLIQSTCLLDVFLRMCTCCRIFIISSEQNYTTIFESNSTFINVYVSRWLLCIFRLRFSMKTCKRKSLQSPQPFESGNSETTFPDSKLFIPPLTFFPAATRPVVSHNGVQPKNQRKVLNGIFAILSPNTSFANFHKSQRNKIQRL